MPRNPEDQIGLQYYLIQKLLPIARMLLFWPAQRKAVVHFAIVFLISSWVAVFPLNDDVYWAKKSNIFNQYGTKIGWFWTLVTVGPFIWATTYAVTKSIVKASLSLLRLVAATVVWYFILSILIHIERNTGKCMVDIILPNGWLKKTPLTLPRRECIVAGGSWSPGFDVSGHCFLLIFNILIMTKESIVLQHWPTSAAAVRPKTQPGAITTKEAPPVVKCLFLVLAMFHIFWDTQLVITCAYFHLLSEKFYGALAGIGAWAVLYRGVFRFQSVFVMPIVRGKKII